MTQVAKQYVKLFIPGWRFVAMIVFQKTYHRLQMTEENLTLMMTSTCEVMQASLSYALDQFYFSYLNKDSIYISTTYDGIGEYENSQINQVDSSFCCLKEQSFGNKMNCDFGYNMMTREDFEEINKNVDYFTFTEPEIKDDKAVIIINFERKKVFASYLILLVKVNQSLQGKEIVVIAHS